MKERNIVLENFENIEGLKDDVYSYLLNLVEKAESFFYKDGNISAVLVEKNRDRYLIVNRDESLQVYYEPRLKDQKPFDYANIKEGQIYSPKIIAFPNEKFFENKYKERYKDLDEKSRNILLKSYKKIDERENKFTITSSIYGLNNFFEAIGQPPILKELLEKKSWNILLKDDELDIDVQEIKSCVERMREAAEQNNYTINNKYDFNDLDNRIWIQNEKLCFSSQNFGFVVEQKENNVGIYIYPRDDEILKEQINIKTLIAKIDNNEINDIRNTVLKLEGEKITFIDPYMFDAMFGNLGYAIENLEDEEIIEIKIPPNEKNLTPDEYVTNMVIKYPTLYLQYDFQKSKLRVLDHVFNTIGSGNDNFQRLVVGKSLDFSKIENWFGEQDIFEIEKNGVRKIVMEDPKDEGYKIHKSKDNCVVPYPNFQKNYSVVYSEDFKNSDESWKKAALEFYTYAKEFFQDKDKREAYHYCFEIDNYNPDSANSTNFLLTENNISNKMRRLVHDMKKIFENMSVEQISKDYEVEFIGDKTNDTDIMNFLQNRWFKEKERIEIFLDETISMIENDLNKTKRIKP